MNTQKISALKAPLIIEGLRKKVKDLNFEKKLIQKDLYEAKRELMIEKYRKLIVGKAYDDFTLDRDQLNKEAVEIKYDVLKMRLNDNIKMLERLYKVKNIPLPEIEKRCEKILNS